MVFSRQFTTEDKAIQFELFFDRDEMGALIMETRVHWLYRPEDVFRLPRRTVGNKILFDHTFSGGDRVHGTLKGISFIDPSVDDNAAIWGDFFYRYRNMDLGHFEGVMVSWRKEGQDDLGETPSAVDRDPSATTSADLNPTTTPGQSGGELFPYIYIHGWPSLSPQDRANRFLFFQSAQASDPGLFKTLSTLRAANASRDQYIAAACAYVDQAAGASPGFVADPRTLSSPLAQFASALQQARSLSSLDRTTLTALINPTLDLKTYLSGTPYTTELAQVWDAYFALVVLAGYQIDLLQKLTDTLIFANLLEAVILRDQQTDLEALLRARIVLPSEVFPLPPSAIPPADQASWQSHIDTFVVGDLQMVRHRPLRYEVGEIAQIINLMRGERKEITRRKRHREERVNRDRSENAKQVDQIEAERNQNLKREIKKLMSTYKVDHTYTNFDTSYGPPTTATLNGDYAMTLTPSAPGNEERSRFARDILNRTTNRLAERIQNTRLSHILDECEETETSIYDNSGGDGNAIGIYRWVNQVYEARLETYGSRLLLEVFLRDPASHYLGARSDLAGTSLLRLPTLAESGVKTYQDLDEANYADLAARYQLHPIVPPPAAVRKVGTSLQNEVEKALLIPEGYQAKSAVVTCALPSTTSISEVNGIVGTQLFNFTQSGTQTLTLADEDGELPIVLLGSARDDQGDLASAAAGELVVTVEVSCALSQTRLRDWQVQAWSALNKAYGSANAQRDRSTDVAPKAGTETGSPTAAAIERREMKHSCLNLLLSAYCDPTSKVTALGAARSPGQFFSYRLEQMFEWDELTYSLHADWADPHAADGDGKGRMGDPHDWSERGGEQDAFAYFLRAQAARVLLPVKPAYNTAVLYYLSTGTLWLSPRIAVPVHEADVTLQNELDRLEQEVPQSHGPSWEFALPTTMQILHTSNLNNLAPLAAEHASAPTPNLPPPSGQSSLIFVDGQ